MFYNNLHQAFHHGKKTLGDLYNGAIKYAGQLDHAFNVGKRLYGAIHPLLGAKANNAIMSGIKQIDEGLHDVLLQLRVACIGQLPPTHHFPRWVFLAKAGV